MSTGPRYRVPFRRRRQGRTDYQRRLKLLRSGRPRAVVRIGNVRVRVALTAFDPAGDRVLAAAESGELTRAGFPRASLGSTPAAYLTGYLAGLRAKARGTDAAILDLGLRHPSRGGRLWGALRGLLDAGVEIPHDEAGFPRPERLEGRHLPKPVEGSLDDFRRKLTDLSAGAKPEGT